MNDDETRREYRPREDRSLSDAVLDAIQEYRNEDISKGDFRLYDDVDPDALDDLFREDANANTTVAFNTDDVTVTLWGDGGVEIRVTSRHDRKAG